MLSGYNQNFSFVNILKTYFENFILKILAVRLKFFVSNF